MPALISQVATRRLIDASATLDPADRALLNLWINRGLEDDAIARLASLNPDSIVARRAALVAHLSEQLGLPPETVLSALEELAASARAGTGPASDVPAFVGDSPALNGEDPALGPAAEVPSTAGESAVARVAKAEPAKTESPDPGPPAARRRRGAFLILFAGAVAVVLVVVVIVLLASGDGGHSRAAVPTNTVPQTSSAAIPASRTEPQAQPLAGLPGGGTKAAGSVTVTGPGAHPRLELAATGLPRLRSGHYEIWLYNSILDSQPLARLVVPASRIVVALPANYRRYSWIDISIQPPGAVNHSGLSVLRAAVPRG